MTTTTTYAEACSEYTGNHENDFDRDFSWTIYAHDESDWIHNRNPVGISINHERFFILWNSLADTEFLGWTIGWYCDEISRDPICEDEWDRFGPRSESLEMVPGLDGTADMINVEASQGYCSNPTCRLADILDSEECYWLGDAAYVRDPETGYVYRCMPQYYGGDSGLDVIDIPRDGHGWLSDCSLDTNAWIEAVLNSGNAREYTNEMVEWLSDDENSPEWGENARVGHAFTAIIAMAESEE